jgi:hypothetical protein
MKRGLYGFWFHYADGSTFIIDATQLHQLKIQHKDRELTAAELTSMMAAATVEYDAVYFADVGVTVEPAVTVRSAPRFVVLKPLVGDGEKFARVFEPTTGHQICYAQDGTLVYEIVGFADNSLDLNEFLYHDANKGFPRSTLKKAARI